jgi:hypothetical protein
MEIIGNMLIKTLPGSPAISLTRFAQSVINDCSVP